MNGLVRKYENLTAAYVYMCLSEDYRNQIELMGIMNINGGSI